MQEQYSFASIRIFNIFHSTEYDIFYTTWVDAVRVSLTNRCIDIVYASTRLQRVNWECTIKCFCIIYRYVSVSHTQSSKHTYWFWFDCQHWWRYELTVYMWCFLDTDAVDDKFCSHLFVHDALTSICNKEVFLQDFLVLLKRMLQKY